jgi:Uma2 family endonuclease
MNVLATPKLMTTEELLALPDDGKERWLIDGQLREGSTTVRNRWHSATLIRLGHLLSLWLYAQPEPRGELLGGEAGCRLGRNPDTTVGIDLVFISAELAAQKSPETTLINGVPTLAVEILSPSDKVEEIDEKVDKYIHAGVPVVWVVDTHDRTVTVYQPGAEPVTFNSEQELSGDPHLRGFRIPVSQIFHR